VDQLERVWREHAGSMLGVLARRLGDLDLAEEALQDAVAAAPVALAGRGGARRNRPVGW
jgi:RNA polymerase sigma-70 factor (ECF subfamily)